FRRRGGYPPGPRRTGRAGRRHPARQHSHGVPVDLHRGGGGGGLRLPAHLGHRPRGGRRHPGAGRDDAVERVPGRAGPGGHGIGPAPALSAAARRGGGGRVKVILRQDVKSLGKAGQVVEVADGYARNYLIPRGLAVEATRQNLSSLEEQRRQEDRRARQQLEQARADARKLEGKVVTVTARAGEGGRLYGSVTAADVAAA